MVTFHGTSHDVHSAEDRMSPAAPETAYTGSTEAFHCLRLVRKYPPIATMVRHSTALKIR
jgi:hypothetical protein